MNKKISSLRTMLILFFFFTGLLAFALIAFLVYLGSFTKFVPDSASPIFIVVIAGLAFCMVGTAIFAVTSKSFLRPIREISAATKEVAKGNFDVYLDDAGDDFSELGQLTSNFNIMVKELAGIETLRNDFISNVSHEFKTPLASMQGYATLLQDDELTAQERREYSQMIIEDAKQLSQLTSNVLFLSKIENQDIVLEKKAFRLDESLRKAILMLEPKWSAKELEIIPDLELVTYTGSESMLIQAWVNILDNAIKFTPPGNSIAVELRTDMYSAEVSITDTGCGMAQETVKHIFEKFYQGNSSRSSEGNGLGLAMVKRIVSLEGGKVFVESSPGFGTSFTVSLSLETSGQEPLPSRQRTKKRS